MAIGPNSSLVTLRPDLASSLMQFDLEANQNKMITLRYAPVLEVDEPIGNWGLIPLNELLKTRDTSRLPGGGYTRGNSNFDPEVYKTTERGTEERVDDSNVKTYANYFDAERIAAIRARHIVLQGLETRTINNSITTLTTASYSAAATVKWNDTANSTPIDDVRAAQLAVWGRTGVMPKSMQISEQLFEYLKDNAQIIDRLKYAGFQNPNKDNINAQAVAQALGLDEVLIAGAVMNTADDGQPAVIASIWPVASVVLSVNAKTDNPKEPCFLRTFHWGGDGSTIGCALETYRDDRSRADIVRARMQTGEYQPYSAMGQLITSAYA
jgi:hypothetical protein